MKASVLKKWLNSQAEILENACNSDEASRLGRLSDILAVRKDATIADICKRITKTEQCGDDGARIEPTARLLRLMAESTCAFAKAADAKDLKLFAATIEGKKEECLEAFVSQAIETLNLPQTKAAKKGGGAQTGLSDSEQRAYLKRLEEALGDEQGFEEIFNLLSKDSRMKAPDAKKMARAFSGKAGKNKTEALGLIYERHNSLMGNRYRAQAIGGRLAG